MKLVWDFLLVVVVAAVVVVVVVNRLIALAQKDRFFAKGSSSERPPSEWALTTRTGLIKGFPPLHLESSARRRQDGCAFMPGNTNYGRGAPTIVVSETPRLMNYSILRL